MEPIEDVDLERIESFSDLVSAMTKGGGFMGRNMGTGAEILADMFLDEDCTVFLSFTGNTVATGLRGIYRLLAKRKLVDVIITTAGTWDHDVARSWRSYYAGDFLMDDGELLEKGIHRLGNVLVPFDNYGKVIEEKVRSVLEAEYRRGARKLATYELSWLLGRRAVNEDAILYWAERNKIPVIVPGPTDGAVGSQLFFFQQTHRDFQVDLLKDEKLLSETIFNSERTGALIIGGGISKHHLLWWNQFKDGLDYAVQITTATEFDGSLSGARLDEAVSWRKVSKKARRVNIVADATLVLPLMIKAIIERL